ELVPWGDVNEDGVIDQRDVDLIADAILGITPLPNPYASPLVSAPVASTNGTNILLTGVARPNRTIIVQGGQGTFFAMADSNGLTGVNVTLQSNRVNNPFRPGSNAPYTAGTPQPVKIIQDSQPPSLFIDFPTNNQVLTTSNTVIAGRVGDMLSGFMGLNVTLKSQPSTTNSFTANMNVGIGNNGTFERSLVPLTPGTNVITVTASDALGNTTNKQISVLYSPITNPVPRLVALSGDMQITNVHRRLAHPVAVRVIQADGTTPIANTLVDFEITRSDGRLLPVDPSTAANPSALTNDITRTVQGIMH